MLTFLTEIMGLASALQIVSISAHPLVWALFLKVMVKKNSHGNVLNLWVYIIMPSPLTTNKKGKIWTCPKSKLCKVLWPYFKLFARSLKSCFKKPCCIMWYFPQGHWLGPWLPKVTQRIKLIQAASTQRMVHILLCPGLSIKICLYMLN